MKFEVKTEKTDVMSVHTTYGRLKFKNVDQAGALALYADAMGITPEQLAALNPTVKPEKVVRPCLVKSKSKNSEVSSSKQLRSQPLPNAKE